MIHVFAEQSLLSIAGEYLTESYSTQHNIKLGRTGYYRLFAEMRLLLKKQVNFDAFDYPPSLFPNSQPDLQQQQDKQSPLNLGTIKTTPSTVR